ncbi:MAG: SIS domain-containing protein [Parachlamydiaceae bacterium]|nr:SIS domain-containing protein [Parachlamydiaceae bacterium]
MKPNLDTIIQDCIKAIEQLQTPTSKKFIEDVGEALANCFRNGNKVLLAGNGGSLCDASHFAEELTGFFRKKRQALPAIALNDPGHITCTGNDLGFDWIFSRGIEALGKPGDIFIGLTTSGNSANIINAFEEAKKRNLLTVAFLGKGGGQLKGIADFELIIDGFATSDRIQEAHMTAIHVIIELMESHLFYCIPQAAKF